MIVNKSVNRTAMETVIDIVGMITDVTAPVTAVDNGYIRFTGDIAYAAFYSGTTGIQQFMVSDYFGEFVITEIDFFDNLLHEDGFFVLLEDGSRVIMEEST